jgi:3-oxoacyl-[acyl-carrier-protein] synthase II
MASPVAISAASALTPAGRTSMTVELSFEHLPAAVRERAARVERLPALVLAAGGAALAAAGLDDATRALAGVVLGTAFGCFLTNVAYQQRLAMGGEGAASPRLFSATVSNAAVGELGIAYGLAGPGITLSAGGASGLLALGHAVDWIRAGRAPALVAGGADALGDGLVAWLASGGLTCGRAPAEAAALLVLEDGAARRWRRPALGFLLGHAGGFEPDPAGPTGGDALAVAVESALAEAALPMEKIEVVVSGAPPHLRVVEERALARVLGERRPCTIAPKETLGETFGAAGPLGLLAALATVPAGAGVLALDVCASGHVAALVASGGERSLA